MKSIVQDFINTHFTVEKVITSKFDITFILKEDKNYVCKLILWENNIVECKIENTVTNYYYLHFELEDTELTKRLLNDFYEFTLNFFDKKPYHVFISCSSGFTSSLLAEGINRIINDMNYQISIEYGSCFKLDQSINEYDLILLAPQVDYFRKQIQHPHVKTIPTNIYASSNYHLLLILILEFKEKILDHLT